MLNNLWMAKFGSELIKPEYFEVDDEEAVALAIIQYRESYGHSPRDADDLIALVGSHYSSLVSRIFNLYEACDNQLASDEVMRFAKGQAAKLAILESVDDVEKGEYDKPIQRMQEVLQVGMFVEYAGLDPITDVDKWLYDYWDDKVRTGLPHLDMVLEGGLGAPELGIILAPPNRGKSAMLVNLGYGAASIGSGKNVLHFTHEMKVEQVAKRYAARIAFRFPQRDDNLSEYEEDFLKAAKKLVTGKIRIMGGVNTIPDMELRITRLIDEGFKPDIIIDDYPDLLRPSKHYEDRRFELSDTYSACRNISDKFRIPFWGASQSRRESLSKEIITMQDIAEDIGKAAIADTIVALCQTWEEEQAEQCRLFIAKLRDGSRRKPLIACKYYSASQSIISTGFVERKEEKDA
jgi:replicative DNA helicase